MVRCKLGSAVEKDLFLNDDDSYPLSNFDGLAKRHMSQLHSYQTQITFPSGINYVESPLRTADIDCKYSMHLILDFYINYVKLYHIIAIESNKNIKYSLS